MWFDYINPSQTWNFRYKRNYATQILINQYDSNVRLSHQIQLVDAFPISISQMDLNWNDDNYHKLSVTFAYTYWERTSSYEPEYEPTIINPNAPSYIDNLQKIISTASLAKDIASNLGKNPWSILSAVGAASSIFTTDTTLSSLLNGNNINRNRFETDTNIKIKPIITGGKSDVDDMEADK